MQNNTERIKKLKIIFVKRFANIQQFNLINCVLELFLDELVYPKISAKELNEFDFLIIYGNVSDLNDEAVIGLMAHLYGQLMIDFEKQPYPFTSKGFYQLDLGADELAKKWGFEKEISELRRYRPQKLIEGLFYNKPILKQSIPNVLFFEKQIQYLRGTQNKAILYTHSFSIGINLRELRSEYNEIEIITSNDI